MYAGWEVLSSRLGSQPRRFVSRAVSSPSSPDFFVHALEMTSEAGGYGRRQLCLASRAERVQVDQQDLLGGLVAASHGARAIQRCGMTDLHMPAWWRSEKWQELSCDWPSLPSAQDAPTFASSSVDPLGIRPSRYGLNTTFYQPYGDDFALSTEIAVYSSSFPSSFGSPTSSLTVPRRVSKSPLPSG